MATSSRNSANYCHSFNWSDEGIECRCRLPVKVQTSHSEKNPNRRYLRCQLQESGIRCKFWKWLDLPNPHGLRIILPTDSDLDVQRPDVNYWIGEARRQAKLVEDSTAKIRELEVKHQDLKNLKKKMKKELFFCRIVICCLCILLLSIKLG